MDRRDYIALSTLATATPMMGATTPQALQRQLQSEIYTPRLTWIKAEAVK